MKFISYRIVFGVMVLCFALSISLGKAATPGIAITNIPAYGITGGLGGYVTNVNVATNCVLVCAFISDTWESEPSCDSQLTPIQTNGSWTLSTTLKSTATEVAAFIVPTNYNAACVNGEAGLEIPTNSEALVYADRVATSARQFNFSGYGWYVKNSGKNTDGPGPNYFTQSTNNIWVDSQGLLHLAVTYTSNEWQCVEIISDESFGYGQYRFTVSGTTSNLYENTVLGMFTWTDDTSYNDREIDIEASYWDDDNGKKTNEDFAISPYNNGQTIYFDLPSTVTNSTHSFIWTPTNVSYQCLNGNFASPAQPANIIETWNCGIGVPPAGGEQVHINLWLIGGNPPTGSQTEEVTLSQFQFSPLGAPQPAQMSQPDKLSNGQFQFGVQGVPQAHYEILSTSNLLAWPTNGPIIRATNQSTVFSSTPMLPVTFQYIDTNPPSTQASFYNVLTEP